MTIIGSASGTDTPYDVTGYPFFNTISARGWNISGFILGRHLLQETVRSHSQVFFVLSTSGTSI